MIDSVILQSSEYFDRLQEFSPLVDVLDQNERAGKISVRSIFLSGFPGSDGKSLNSQHC